jgi:site-specific DNA recombinase
MKPMPAPKRTRCAIYTRKSTEEGLEMEFNSLDAQREAGEAYIASQRHEGWMLIPEYYDDGGFSGGSMDRPALKRLLADIAAGKIDVIVVYKVDRLSRSLSDFAKMVEIFDSNNVSFVSVTQQFNTTTSMGRLTLNILLSFAQFEREVIGERVRDKVAASKRKGMWMGGSPPYGYDVVDKRLVINPTEAERVRYVFQRFITLGSATLVTRELRVQGQLTKSYTTSSGRQKQGRLVDKSFVYFMLSNPAYIGQVRHKGKTHPGQHQPIISQETWDAARGIIQESPYTRAGNVRAKTGALLRGVIKCGGCLSSMTPTHTRKPDKMYRYYTPIATIKGGCTDCPVGRIPASEVEELVLEQLTSIFRAPEMILRVWREARKQDETITEKDVVEAFQNMHTVWAQLFPAEQSRIVKLLIKQVVVHKRGVDVQLRADGITTLTLEVQNRLEVAVA